MSLPYGLGRKQHVVLAQQHEWLATSYIHDQKWRISTVPTCIPTARCVLTVIATRWQNQNLLRYKSSWIFAIWGEDKYCSLISLVGHYEIQVEPTSCSIKVNLELLLRDMCYQMCHLTCVRHVLSRHVSSGMCYPGMCHQTCVIQACAIWHVLSRNVPSGMSHLTCVI